MERYYQKEIETADREQILAWQNERLVKQVRHVWDNVPYYRKKMEEKGVTPEDIQGLKDLHKLPFLTKDDLREAYPYGLLAKPLKDCVRIQSTSGTTGRRVVAFYTQHDIDLWEDCCARAIMAAGGTSEDVCHVSYGYGLFTGGPGLNGGSHKVGCLTLPMSSGNTDRQLQFMVDLESTILCCTPSYAAFLAESIHERGLRDKIKLKAGIFGGRIFRRSWESKPMIFTGSRKPAGRELPLSAANRPECISMKTTLSPRLSTRIRERFSRRAAKASWCSPRLPRRRFPFCATAQEISACLPERSAPAAVPM